MADDEWETEEWTYVGRVLGFKKMQYRFIRPGEGDVFYSAAPTGPVVGGVYSVEVKPASEGLTARVQGASYIRMSDSESLTTWRMDDKTAQVEQERRRAAKRMAAENSDIGALTLAEVAAIIGRQLPHQRAGTLAVVLQYVGKGVNTHG